MEYDRRRYAESPPSTPPKQRRIPSICFPCCFRGEADSDVDRPESLIRSSSAWIRSKAHELPEVKNRCIGLVSRIGRHRRQSSDGFRYDPLSYALNFDDGADESPSDFDLPHRNFSSRLPASPPPPLMAAQQAVEIACG